MTDLALPSLVGPSRPVARVLTAAATSIALSEPGGAAKRQVGLRQEWQTEAWAYYDEVPEIHYATMLLGAGISKVVFFAAYEMDDGSMVPINSEKSPVNGTALAADAIAEMRRLSAPIGGQPEMNRSAALNLEITGEFFLHGRAALPESGVVGAPGYQPGTPEQWDVRSVAQIETSNESDTLGRPQFLLKQSPSDRGTMIDNDNESLIRIWQRHPKWSELADCHLRGCLSDCETLLLLMNQQKAEAKSRQSAGILLVPSELSFADDAENGDDEDQPANNPFVAALLQALIAPIEDPSAPESVMPLVITAPGEHLTPDRFRLLTLSRNADTTLDARIMARIERLARGLNLPVEKILGHQHTTFSNAEQIDRDTFDDHWQPRCQMLGDGYAYGFLLPNLVALGHNPEILEKVHVAFEPGLLLRGKTAAENADALWHAGVISATAYRKLKGVHEDDAPTIEEGLMQVALQRGMITTDLTTTLIQHAGVDLGLEINPNSLRPMVAPEGTVPLHQPDPPPSPDSVATGPVAPSPGKVASARRDTGADLASIDRDLRARLQGAAEAAMDRALEKAGNRLKNQNRLVAAGVTMRDHLRTVPAYQAAAVLGPDGLADSGTTTDELLDGAWDTFGVQFKLWTKEDAHNAVAILAVLLGASFTVEQRLAVLAEIATRVDEAWVWLQNAMTEVGKRALFAPQRSIEVTVGEWAQNVRIPPGVLREALAIAGGASGIRGRLGVVIPSNLVPSGGVATGDLIMEALRQSGGDIAGWQWMYGAARRVEFPPHAALDGSLFQSFDDALLANTTENWLGVDYFFPGDHDGCQCDIQPIILSYSEADNGA